MNERIKELARQTGLCDADGDFFGGKIGQYEEFALLIVLECAEWVNDNLGLVDEEARKDLLKHFGVEE